METKSCSLVVDGECPLCVAYSQAFVQQGMLSQEGRIFYQHLREADSGNIDLNRARNEIALVMPDGSVRYGVDSLLTLLQPRYPILGTLMKVGFLKILPGLCTGLSPPTGKFLPQADPEPMSVSQISSLLHA